MLGFRGYPEIEDLELSEVLSRIQKYASGLAKFWGASDGWAPSEAADLIGKSRLDWQESLAETLVLWADPRRSDISDGELILGWANLGALIEGSMKLFLAVWYQDYKNDIHVLRKRNDEVRSPDGLMLTTLIEFFRKAELLDPSSLDFADYVRDRRNAIHAFQSREIGDLDEFRRAVRNYLRFLRVVDDCLPYPEHWSRNYER